MAKTGPHSFTDATGVEWVIEGYSRACGAAYVDCRSLDGNALTVRPLAYLSVAGLSLPEGIEPPKRKPTAAEKRKAAEETARYAPALQVAAEHVGVPVPVSIGTSTYAVGRFVLFEPTTEGEALVTSWDDWADAHTNAFPVPEGMVLRDDATNDIWTGPVECECGNCYHERYGCLLCGDKTGACNVTMCTKESILLTRVVHCKREPYDVYIGRPGPWGNPYTHMTGTSAQYIVGTVEEAIDHYRQWLRQRVRESEPGLIQALADLHGKVLGCYCAPGPCHGTVLAEAAAWAILQV